MGKERATLQDLALAAGVSKMTVSRALRGERGIASSTRARIRAIAEKLSYRPDPAISALMGHLRKSRITELEPLAWLTTYPTIGGWESNPGTREMHRGATEQARKLGYRLEEFSLNTPGMTARRLSSILYNQSLRGIVLAPLVEHGSIEGFAWEHFATACCGHSLLSPALHRVSVDQFEVFLTASHHLALAGYKRIGLCVSATDNARIGHRWQGAQSVKADFASESSRVPPMITDDWNIKVFERWFRRHRPDVVLSFAGTLDWLKAIGVRVPRDCGFALLRLDQAKNIAGMDHRFADIGAAAVSLVVSELAVNQYGVPAVRKSVSIEPVWRDGPTVIDHVSRRRSPRRDARAGQGRQLQPDRPPAGRARVSPRI